MVFQIACKPKVKKVSEAQTGYLYHYAFVMLVGVTILITMIGLKDQLSTWLDYRLYPQFLVALGVLQYYSSKK